jgi:hypothetical protein
MRRISIAAVFFTASLLGVAPAAQAVKVTFETLVSTDTKTQGGRSITMPFTLNNKVLNQPIISYGAPSIDKQDIVFSAQSADFISKTEKDATGKILNTHTSGLGLYALYQGDGFDGKPFLITRDTGKAFTIPASPNGYANEIMESYTYRAIDIKDKDVVATKILDRSEFSPDFYVGSQSGGRDETATVLMWQPKRNRKEVLTLGSCKYEVRSGFGGNVSGDGVSLAGNRSAVITGSGGGCPANFGTDVFKNGDQVISQLWAGKKQVLYQAKLGSEYASVSSASVSARENSIVFVDRSALYSLQNGKLSPLFSPGQQLPGLGKFLEFCGSDFDGKNIVVCGRDEDYNSGIYLKVGNQFKAIATLNKQVTAERSKSSRYETPRISGDYILFTSSLGPTLHVYVQYKDKITKVISQGGMIKGKKVAAIALGKRPISGNQVVFAARFEDGTSSIIKAKLSF